MAEDWVVAVLGRKYAAFKLSERGMPEMGDAYDPEGIRTKRLRWHMRQRMTKERACALVDKLNGPRGDLTEV